MGRALDYTEAKQILEAQFVLAEGDYRARQPANLPEEEAVSISTLFQSRTQAFREALVGCCIARIMDPEIDIRYPYMGQADNAYNGRTLDERVVNPFLRSRATPCSRGPFLSVFRRNVGFVEETAAGLRDKTAFSAMLEAVDALRTGGSEAATGVIRYLLYKFIELREQSNIELLHVRRLSMEQQIHILNDLLSIPSGGLLPVLLSAAMFRSISDVYSLSWRVEWQGINVADAATGAAGDILVTVDEEVLFSVEVTERPVDGDRVRSTFVAKMSPNNVEDYLFLLAGGEAAESARSLARSYFAQGHEINFLPLAGWMESALALLGAPGRARFTENAVALLGGRDIPASVKVAWNDCVRRVV